MPLNTNEPGSQYLYNVIKQSFEGFGYTPSDEEIASLMGTAEGQTGGVQRATQAVGNYVNTVRQLQNASSNDPLKQVLSDEKGFYNDTQAKAADLYSKATGAPKLFGGMTPEQIDQYLAPAKTALSQGLAQAESTFARRGLPGSNIEAGALSEQGRIFGENALATGLNVGLQEQDRNAALYSQLYGLLPGSLQRQGNISDTLSANARTDVSTRTSLPSYLNSYTLGQRAFNDNEIAQIMAEQAAKEAGHKNSGFSWNVGLGPLQIGQNSQGGTSAGLNLSTKDIKGLLSPTPTPDTVTSSNPTSGAIG